MQGKETWADLIIKELTGDVQNCTPWPHYQCPKLLPLLIPNNTVNIFKNDFIEIQLFLLPSLWDSTCP